jgi:hypothetical protein
MSSRLRSKEQHPSTWFGLIVTYLGVEMVRGAFARKRWPTTDGKLLPSEAIESAGALGATGATRHYGAEVTFTHCLRSR